jgi:hypothetical protein
MVFNDPGHCLEGPKVADAVIEAVIHILQTIERAVVILLRVAIRLKNE